MSLGRFPFEEHGIIAVVDPRPEDYWQLAERVESAGSYCRYATTAENALRLAEVARPGLWLVNLKLPDMSGQDLFRLLRPRFAGTPHFLISDTYDPQAEITALAEGGRFLCKPISAELWEAVTGPRVRPARVA